MSVARTERGSATVWVLALAILVSGGAAGVIAGVQARVARAAAATAADLAALAAARELPAAGAACAEAARVATAQGAQLVACSVDGTVVSVVVARQLGGAWAGLGPVTVRSRAGPPAAP